MKNTPGGEPGRAAAHDSRTDLQPGPELSVVAPTLNERDNVEELVRRLDLALRGVDWEIIFVDDDSHDGTAELARNLARRDRRVRVLRRLGRRGLASATIEGMLSSSAPYVAVIDADLQHDETLLPAMLRTLEAADLDIVIGSRVLDQGTPGFASRERYRMSRIATFLSRSLLSETLSDPMSGFFVVKREVVDEAAPRLSGIGFKILLDLLASAPRPLRWRELPYTFRTRHAGESKLDSMVAWEYLMLIADKLVGGILCPEDESGDARMFTQALAAKAREAGVRFQFGAEVTGFETNGNRVAAILTAQGRHDADAIVVAAGSWSPLLLNKLGITLPVRPVKGYSITVSTGAWPTRPGLPIVDAALHAAITPFENRLRVAGTAEFAGYDAPPNAGRINNLFDLLLSVYPSFAPHLDRSNAQPWAGLRPVAADGVPRVGTLKFDNLYVNAGHGHLGWTFAAGSGRLLADLVMKKSTAIDAKPYDAER